MKLIMKLNAVVILLMIVLFFAHALMASMSTLGFLGNFGTQFSKIAFYLMFLHILLVTIRTIQMFVPELRSIEALKKAGNLYGGFFRAIPQVISKAEIGKKIKKQNLNFWLTRFSGIVFLGLVFLHKSWIGRGASIGNNLTFLVFTVQILFIVVLFVHIIFNVRPLLSKLGIKNSKVLKYSVLSVLTLMMIFIIRGMLYYYYKL